MIVRNEEATLERCLRAALPHIDAAVICDTGSTDRTRDLARTLLGDAKLPAAVLRHRWRDFGSNRTLAVRAASRYISRRRWDASRSWYLFLDADHELVSERGFRRSALDGDAIALQQRTSSLAFWNVRLGRASLAWRAVGATHEYYTAEPAPQVERRHDLWIRDHDDGGFKADKFRRDLELLTAALARTPDDPRTLFYLARTWEALGDPLKAIVLYRRRIAAGGWHEEVFYSQLSIGRLLAATGDANAAAAALEEAHRRDPLRAEPLHELARLARRNGHFAHATEYALRGRQLPPAEQALFVHSDVQRELDVELALSAAGTVHHERGFEACERLLLEGGGSAAERDALKQAAIAYAAPLAGAEFLPLKPATRRHYFPCNPSIVRRGRGYVAICRTVNYVQSGGYYQTANDDPFIRTRNVLMRFDARCRVVSEREIVIDEPPLRRTRIQGLEDCRLFELGGALHFTCTTADRHPSGHLHMSLCRLGSNGRVSSHLPLIGPFDDRVQKNWLPFVARGRLHAVYGYDPFTIVRVLPVRGRYRVQRVVAQPVVTRDWRGSAGPIAIPRVRRQLLLVHEVAFRALAGGGAARVYLHRFIECNSQLSITRVSRPFVFAHFGIEFACGMTVTHDQRALLIGLGIEDRSAYLCRIPLTRVESLLHPIS